MRIIAIVGKTATGKDSLAGYIREMFGISPIVSYTTRKKRDSEIDGREHYFVSDEEMDKLFANKESLLAYAVSDLTGVRYCTTIDGLSDDAVFTYIINPKALTEMKESQPGIDVVTIALDLSEKRIMKRALKRGDNIEDVKMRLEAERDEFDKFLESGPYDAKIDSNRSLPEVFRKVKMVLQNKGFQTKVDTILVKNVSKAEQVRADREDS